MKISRAFVVILMMALFVAGWAASGQTAGEVYVCRVNGAGPNHGVVQITLTDTANPRLSRINRFEFPRLRPISSWRWPCKPSAWRKM